MNNLFVSKIKMNIIIYPQHQMMNIMFNRNFNPLIYQNVSFSKKNKKKSRFTKRILELQKEILRRKHTTKAFKTIQK